jgi:hypothetical protein
LPCGGRHTFAPARNRGIVPAALSANRLYVRQLLPRTAAVPLPAPQSGRFPFSGHAQYS